MKQLQILGSGCPKCRKLTENAKAAAEELGIEYKIEKVTEITEILKFGVMMTPALVVDGVIKSVGKVLTPGEIRRLLTEPSG